MKSFQTIYEELQEHTGDDNATQLARFKKHINETQHSALAHRNWKFLEETENITTIADIGFYALPANLNKIISVVSLDTSNEIESIPRPIENADEWERIKYRNSTSSDIIKYYYQEGNYLLIWPDFSTAGKTIRVRYRKQVIDMTKADYTTGTITSITNGASALVGASTSWESRKPVGEQWIRIDQTDGDYQWYKVSSIDSDTAITLAKKYQGTTILAASATYTLGEMPTIPSAYQDLLVYRPLALYYAKLENVSMSKYYWNLYDGGYEIGDSTRVRGLLGKMMKEQEGMLDTFYMKPIDDSIPDPELLAKDQTSTLG